MLEISCTLRCDRCKETTPVVAEAEHTGVGPVRAFVITDNALPAGWYAEIGQLRCPRCNGAK